MVEEIKVGMFCRVQDSTFAEYGVKKDSIIYVAGDSVVHTGANDDPYALRKVFIGAFMKGDIVDADKKPFIIDGKRLKPVSKALQERLDAALKLEFGDKEENEAAD